MFFRTSKTCQQVVWSWFLSHTISLWSSSTWENLVMTNSYPDLLRFCGQVPYPIFQASDFVGQLLLLFGKTVCGWVCPPINCGSSPFLYFLHCILIHAPIYTLIQCHGHLCLSNCLLSILSLLFCLQEVCLETWAKTYFPSVFQHHWYLIHRKYSHQVGRSSWCLICFSEEVWGGRNFYRQGCNIYGSLGNARDINFA